MPGIFHQPLNRRDYLKTTALAGAALAVGSFRSAAQNPASAASLHLALLSDTHVPGDQQNGNRGYNPWENLKRIVPEVIAAKPEGVIINGDAARLEGLPEDYVQIKALLEPVAAVAPVYIGLGNHDDRGNFQKTFSPNGVPAANVNGKHVLIIEHPAVRVLVLDSLLYVNQTAGLLGRNQRNWLADYLPKNTDRPIVLFIHHTLGDGDGELLDADRLFEILKPNPQVKAIFYGHSHVWEISERQGVQLVNLPAVGYNFSDTQPVGWVDARFHPTGADLTLHAFGGNTADNGKTTSVKWS